MKTDFLLIYILLIHFLADFGLQTHEQANQKGVGDEWFNRALLQHVGVYSFIWFIATLPLLGISAVTFAVITFVLHYYTDWFTSRIGKPFWEKKDFHNGFLVVGFDQVLHYLQLWFTFRLLL